MTSKRAATESPIYKKFTRERDQVLERIHNRAQAEINDILRGLFARAMEIIAFRYSQILPESLLTQSARAQIFALDLSIDTAFTHGVKDMVRVIQRMKAASYALAVAGEGEAIGLAMGKPAKANVPQGTAQAMSEETFSGESLSARVTYALSNIRRDIMSAIEQARVMGENTQECLERVRKALPSYRLVRKPKRVLKVKEAEFQIGTKKEPASFSMGFIDQDVWDDIVEDAMEEYLPRVRVDGALIDPRSPKTDALFEDEQRYSWEIENEVTNEFVHGVREGKNETARQNGITDMMWIAVIDGKTCAECCAWRDGLSSRQIIEKLATTHKEDDCQVIVPPAHFNCRCDIAPILEGMPEAPESLLPEFTEWLMSKAQR